MGIKETHFSPQGELTLAHWRETSGEDATIFEVDSLLWFRSLVTDILLIQGKHECRHSLLLHRTLKEAGRKTIALPSSQDVYNSFSIVDARQITPKKLIHSIA